MNDCIEFIDLEDGMKFEQNGYKVTALKMEHGAPETYGFIFEDKFGKIVGFSGDTAECENLHNILAKADFAFVEMALSKISNDIYAKKTHISTSEFVELTRKYPNCKMFPVHTTDETQKFAEENGLNSLHDGDLVCL